MDDYFKKEVAPFARPRSDEVGLNDFHKGIRKAERWSFLDKGVYNRAVKIKWDLEVRCNTQNINWTEFQRRAKHLLAVELELETIIDWIIESCNKNTLKLIRVEPENKQITEISNSFWNWDLDIEVNGLKAFIFTQRESAKLELEHLMDVVLMDVLEKNSDGPLIEVKKHLSDVLREIYDLVICTCPWEGRIWGGPMLPQQKLEFNCSDRTIKIKCRFEFSILGARAADLVWLKDLKLPALSHSSVINIHYGARRAEQDN